MFEMIKYLLIFGRYVVDVFNNNIELTCSNIHNVIQYRPQ